MTLIKVNPSHLNPEQKEKINLKFHFDTSGIFGA